MDWPKPLPIFLSQAERKVQIILLGAIFPRPQERPVSHQCPLVDVPPPALVACRVLCPKRDAHLFAKSPALMSGVPPLTVRAFAARLRLPPSALVPCRALCPKRDAHLFAKSLAFMSGVPPLTVRAFAARLRSPPCRGASASTALSFGRVRMAMAPPAPAGERGRARPNARLAVLGAPDMQRCRSAELDLRPFQVAVTPRRLAKFGWTGSHRNPSSPPSPKSGCNLTFPMFPESALMFHARANRPTKNATAPSPGRDRAQILGRQWWVEGVSCSQRRHPRRFDRCLQGPQGAGVKAAATREPTYKADILSFIVLPLPPRRAAVADSRAYRKWRGAAPLRAR